MSIFGLFVSLRLRSSDSPQKRRAVTFCSCVILVLSVGVYIWNFPLPHRNASWLVHQFVLGAAAQGKFWAAEALLLADAKPKDKIELRALASQLGLDQDRLWEEIDTRKYDPLISRDLVQAGKIGVTGTPTFVIGNRKLDGADGVRAFDKH